MRIVGLSMCSLPTCNPSIEGLQWNDLGFKTGVKNPSTPEDTALKIKNRSSNKSGSNKPQELRCTCSTRWYTL